MLCIALMLFLPMHIYWDKDIVIYFKDVLKDPSVNLVMEQPFCSVEPKDANGTSKTKTKLGRLLHLNVRHLNNRQIYCSNIYDQLISI